MLGLIISLIPLLPYIGYELANACPDCESLIKAQSKFSFRYAPELLVRPLQILNQGNFHFVLGSDMLTFTQSFPGIDFLRRLFYSEYILLPLGIIIFFKRYKKLRPLAISVALLPLLYFARKLEPFMHYYIIVLPLLFLFLGVVFNFLIFHKNLFLKYFSRILLFSIIFTSIYFNFAFFKLLDLKGSFQGDYGSAFHISKATVEKDRAELKNEPDYDQIFLSSFIPLEYMYGYEPVAKMLYPDTSEKEIAILEQKLIKNSKDPRVRQEIFAYYTKNELTRDSLEIVRKKSIDIPQFQDIYKEMQRKFLSTSYKKEYTSSEFGFRFLYPEHWIVTEEKGLVIITGDGSRVTIRRISLDSDMSIIREEKDKKYTNIKDEILNQRVNKIYCIENEDRWCGTYYLSIKIADENYFVSFLKDNAQAINNEKLIKTIPTMEDVINSIRR